VNDTYFEGAPTFSRLPSPSLALGDLVLFAGEDATHGDELWAFEGDPAGSQLVADIAPGVRSSHPDHFTAAGNVAYFTATTVAAGNELWRTDGTATGTWQVNDLAAGADSATPSDLQPYKQGLIFETEAFGGIWYFDGSTSTQLTEPGAGFISMSVAVAGDVIYFNRPL